MPQITHKTAAEPLQALVAWLVISSCVFVLLYFGPCLVLWLRWGMGRGVSLLTLMRARIHGIPPKPLARGIAYAKEAKLNLAPRDLELICLAGGTLSAHSRRYKPPKKLNWILATKSLWQCFLKNEILWYMSFICCVYVTEVCRMKQAE